MAHELEDLAEDRRHPGPRQAGLAHPREVQHVADDAGDPIDLRADDPQAPSAGRVVDEGAQQAFRPPADDVERRADLVGEPGGQAADGGETLRVPQPGLDPPAFLLLREEGELRGLQLLEHPVERLRQPAELVAPPDRHAGSQLPRADLAEAAGQLGDRAGHADADHPEDDDRGDQDHQEGEGVDLVTRGARVLLDVGLELHELQGAHDRPLRVPQGNDEAQDRLVIQPVTDLRRGPLAEGRPQSQGVGGRVGRQVGGLVDHQARRVEDAHAQDPLVAGHLVDQGTHVLDLPVAQGVLHGDLDHAGHGAPFARQLVLEQGATVALVDVPEQGHDEDQGNGEEDGQPGSDGHGSNVPRPGTDDQRGPGDAPVTHLAEFRARDGGAGGRAPRRGSCRAGRAAPAAARGADPGRPGR